MDEAYITSSQVLQCDCGKEIDFQCDELIFTQAKLDELFLQWLSMPEAQAYIHVSSVRFT